MDRLRFWILATVVWLFILYNVEKVIEPINLAPFVYVMAMLLIVLIVCFTTLQQLQLRWLLTVPLAALCILKVWGGYPIGGVSLPITVMELSALVCTVLLALRVAAGLEEFRRANSVLAVGALENRAESFETGQAEMYREIRRARLYGRPLTMMAIGATGESFAADLDRGLREIRRATVRRYVLAQLAHVLCEEMSDCDIVAERNGHFLALVPEVRSDQASEIAERIQAAAKEELGMTLRVGLSTFPDEEVTFSSLVERAEAMMDDSTRPARASLHTNRAKMSHLSEDLESV